MTIKPMTITGNPDPGLDSHEVRELLAEVAQLRAALDTRDAIGQAKGIIRLLTHCGSQDAFDALCKVSQDTNRKVKDVAVLFTDCAVTGTALPPDVGASWRRHTPAGDTAP